MSQATPPTLPPLDYATPRFRSTVFFTQTAAILLDAYRELQAKKLFWISLILSGLVVTAFAAVGFNETGFKIFWIQFDNPIYSTRFIPVASLYKNLFITLGVKIWLTYAALILALISTASIFPDFLSSGSVDLYLARPISRLRLIFTKYIAGLLFVALQVFIFCLATFLVLGFRGGVWVPGVFLAIPVVVLIYSYVWSICTVYGVLTRSTIASLLLTLLTWFVIFGIYAAQTNLLEQTLEDRITIREANKDIVRLEAEIALAATRPASTQRGQLENTKQQIREKQLEEARRVATTTGNRFETWHKLFYALYYPLPKTTETPELLERWLNDGFAANRRDAQARARAQRERDREQDEEDEAAKQREARRAGIVLMNTKIRTLTREEMRSIQRARTAPWLIGTSLAFEAAMIGLAVWIFSRRDY